MSVKCFFCKFSDAHGNPELPDSWDSVCHGCIRKLDDCFKAKEKTEERSYSDLDVTVESERVKPTRILTSDLRYKCEDDSGGGM